MGFLIFFLLFGVVIISEIEQIPDFEWNEHPRLTFLLLRRTRKKFSHLLALAVGLSMLLLDVWLTAHGRSTFNWIQAFGLCGILFACVLLAIGKKGLDK